MEVARLSLGRRYFETFDQIEYYLKKKGRRLKGVVLGLDFP